MIRKAIARMNRAAPAAYITLKITLLLSCVIMAAAGICTVLGCDEHIVRELFTLPQSVLIVGGLISVIIEDISS